MLLLAALCAPAGMVRRVRGFRVGQLWLFAQGLSEMCARGERLRYPGESHATMAARIDLHAWLAFDPFAARKHLSRGFRGWKRARSGAGAPPAFTPPRIAVPALRDADAAVIVADTS